MSRRDDSSLTRRRVGATAAVAAGLVTAALVATLTASGSTAPPSSARVELTHASEDAPTAWTDRAMAEECREQPLGLLTAGGTPTIRMLDESTKEFVEVDVRAACLAQVPLTPDPQGDMTARFFLENGQWKAQYFNLRREVVKEPEGLVERITQLDPIPDVEAQARLAQQKAAQPE
jgi:hypothetical protein